jgi:Protein kinase domain
MDVHSGERLGPYLLREQLGEGGMGMVYLASDTGGSLVAVKVLRQGVPAEATARRRLAREVGTMRRVHSPFVAEVVDADVEGSPPYIVTRYVAGRTLEDAVAADGPLAGVALASLARGLAAALVAVHEAGVVHRDLKPANVMMVDDQPVVIDFGIAQAADSTRLTMTGMFMGTPGYLAPEVIEGNASGPASDVHSWAATLAYAATGRPPFGTGQYETIFYRIVHGQPDLDRMPAPLLPIVLAALARDPSRRPSAAELAEFTSGLTPETLLPAPAGAALAGHDDRAQALLSGQATRTALDGQAQLPAASLAAGPAGAVAPAWPVSRPTGTRPQDDFADLLKPVRYSPPPAGPAQRAAGGRGQLPGGQAPAAGPEPGARSASQAGRLPLVLATLAALVAISVLLPIAGAVAALTVLVLLRASDVTSGWLTRRRSRQGTRSSDPVSATAFYPWAVCRSVLSFLLRAPLALLCAAVVAVLAVLAGGPAELPKAGGYAAGAIVACYCIGPGSRACRRPLSSFYGRIARSVPAALIGSFGLAAMVAAVVVAAATMTPGYWPDWHLGNQLQAATSTLSHPALNHLSGSLPGKVTDLSKRLVSLLGRL